MPTDEPLITALIDQVHKVHPLVADTVVARLNDFLKGKLSEDQLTEGELKMVSRSLLDCMAMISPKGETK